MPVEIVLVGATEGEEVIALQHGDVVSVEIILAIPEARADGLRVHVVRGQYRGGKLAERLEGSAEP